MLLGKLEDQIALEKRARTLGIERAQLRNRKLRDSNNFDTTPAGKRLTVGFLDIVEEQLKDRLFAGVSGDARKFSVATIKLRDLEPQVSSAIAIKTSINFLYAPQTYSALVLKIGGAIEDELRTRAFEEHNPALYNKTHNDLIQRGSGYKYKRKKLMESAARDGLDWLAWDKTERAHVGGLLVDIIFSNTDLIDIFTKQRGKRQVRMVSLTDSTVKWVSAREIAQGINEPEFLPMVCPPRPWRGVIPKGPDESERGAGGYITLHAPQISLVKSGNNAYLEELENHNIEPVYSAVNSLQNTMWAVDEFIYSTAAEMWDSGVCLGSLPSQEVVDLPAKPTDIDTNEEARREYRHAAAKAYTDSNRLRSKRFLAAKTLTMAKQFKEYDPLYFVYQLDFRSRAYPVSSYLQPQGNDLARALLRYSDHHAKPMDEQGARHLAIYGASLYGYDKVTLDERVAWVEEHTPQIVASAENPFDNRFWCDTPKSFLFLAFCKEWQGWKEHGSSFYSSLPVMRDGTCNALQHWGAILRDDTIAGLVNLKDQDLPGDAYTMALDILIDRVKHHAELGNESAIGWLNYRLDRELTKKPTMTLTYGAKKFGTTEWLKTWITENKEKYNIDEPFGGEWFKHGVWLTNEIWEAIRETVGAVMEGMTFLQSCAKLAVSAQIPITWFTPCDFYVRQAYANLERRRVKTKLMGQVIRASVNEYKYDDYSRHQMVNGVSANFIHSMDAAAMFNTVNLGVERGVTAYSMIHDSYGTVAADTETLSACTREAFVDLYKDRDVLQEFRDQLKETLPPHLAEKLPELPSKGSFDVSEVLTSQHFFS